ncbi:unnamed protein product [Vicia faba]|uniref:Zeta toxin domain-containing protein n=1 Tax=Vicia faba TaxID=3906 RepID=A0AAV0YH51_VICFA|nr:unnamed protein product [Vicia faba]
MDDIQTDYDAKPSFTQILVISSIWLIFFIALRYHLKKIRDQKIISRLRLSRAGHPPKLERFSHYVARQMGFKDRRIGPDICRLASEYISKYEGFEDDIYSYFENEPDADSLYVKLVEEFERCILSYFGFHWNHCDILISQVLSSDISEPKKKLKNIVMAATRDQRFERVAKSLKVASVFNTLVEEMKVMGIAVNDDSQCTEVMAPVAHSDRSPVLLLMGGGMGAGKSTVLKDILKEPFWAGASGNAVVIEADAFKESDVNPFAGEIVGLKSIAAYYFGLDINTNVTKMEAEEALQQVLSVWKPVLVANKNLVDYIFLISLEFAQSHDLL